MSAPGAHSSIYGMCRVLNISELWISVNFRKYGGVLYMCGDAIMEGFWIFQDSMYAKFLRIKYCARFWICLVNVSQGFKKASDTIRTFFSKIRTLFSIFKKAGEASPLSACLWVCLNTHQYPWIWIHIIEDSYINCSDYVRTSNMHDHLTCSTDFWRYLGF